MDLIKKINLDKIRNVAEDVINQAKPKTEVEARIYEALSHKNWGSSSTLMNEIARDSFDYERYSTITRIIWESLSNQRPAAWRVIFKALTLLEHLIKNGSERCVDDVRNHSHVLRSLFNFNYYEGTVDRGIGVREKSKQIVELVGDDERVREERTKARQLREKFGGNLGGVSSSGGGYGGGGRYAGYGNDDYGGYNGSSGYGDSGIGSSTNSFSGRYNDNDTKHESSISPTADDINAPTFASIPEKKEKKAKKSKKKKKKDADDDGGVAPEIDLLAMDDPIPTTQSNDFDAFQSATTNVDSFDAFGTSIEAPKSSSFDAFGDMQSSSSSKQQPQFDAFHSSAPTTLGSPSQFDAFQSAPVVGSSSNTTFDAFSSPSNNNNNKNSSVTDMFGNMSMNSGMSMNNNVMGQSINNNIMGGGKGKKQITKDEDDFGDFADGNASNNDPLKNLISLDGLTKNSRKEDKVKEPVYFNEAAKNYVEHKDEFKAETTKMSVEMAFSGVDGLQQMNSMNNHSQPMMYNNQGGQSVMNNGNNMMTMNSGMGINNMNTLSSGMNMGMMQVQGNGMNNLNNMTMGMGNMGQGGTMGGMGGMSNNNMMMGGQQGNNQNNNNMMGGQQNGMMNTMQSSGNTMGGMGGQQSYGNMNNMMGGQPMGGGF